MRLYYTVLGLKCCHLFLLTGCLFILSVILLCYQCMTYSSESKQGIPYMPQFSFWIFCLTLCFFSSLLVVSIMPHAWISSFLGFLLWVKPFFFLTCLSQFDHIFILIVCLSEGMICVWESLVLHWAVLRCCMEISVGDIL